MRVVVYVVLITLLLSFLLFFIAFTSIGNSITKPFIESYLQSNIHNDLRLDKFSLSFRNFDIKLTLEKTEISAIGKYDIIAKSVDAVYSIDIKDLSQFEKITNHKLNGAFDIKGSINGDFKELKIVANSNIFDSNSKVELDLINAKPQVLYYTIENARVEKILYMLNQPIYLVGLLNSDGKVDSLALDNLSGIATVGLEDGIINKKELEKYDINLTDVKLSSSTYVELKKDNISFQSKTLSSLANIYLKDGKYNTTTKELNLDSLVEVDNLNKLKNFTKVPLDSSLIIVSKDTYIKDFDTKTLKTNTKISLPSLVPDLADYNITYPSDKPMDISLLINLKDNETSFDTSIKSQLLNVRLYDSTYNLDTKVANFRYTLDIDELLEWQDIIKQTISGKLSIKSDIVNIKDFDINTLKSSQVLELSNSIIDLKEYDINYPQDRPLDILSTIITDNAVANIELEAFSKIFIYTMPKGIYSFKDNKFSGDYKLVFEDLGELKPFAKRDLRGELEINGSILFKDKLKLSADFELANGKSNLLLDDKDLYLKSKNVSLKKLTYMLYYPEVFDSLCELNLNHNLDTKKGKLGVKLTEGHFMPTTMTNLIETFTKFDITGEFYNYVNIDTDINNNILSSKLEALSQNTKIYSNHTIIDKEKQTIDSNLNIVIKDKSLAVNVKGDIKSPQIDVDAKEWIKSRVNEEVNKQIEKHQDKIDKIVPKELQEPIKNIFNNFFK